MFKYYIFQNACSSINFGVENMSEIKRQPLQLLNTSIKLDGETNIYSPITPARYSPKLADSLKHVGRRSTCRKPYFKSAGRRFNDTDLPEIMLNRLVYEKAKCYAEIEVKKVNI